METTVKKTTPKNILVAGSMCGGQYKTTTIATLGDCLHSLGYSVKFIALDLVGKPILQILYPATACYDPRNPVAMHESMDDAIRCPEDIVIIDCPGCGWGKELPEIAATAITEFGARVVIAPIINAQDEYSLHGAHAFSKAFHGIEADDIILANNWLESPETTNLMESRKGKLLIEISEGRVIQFPPFSAFMRQGYNRNPAVPSAYLSDSNPLRAASWEKHHKECLQSVSQYAEWLTGKVTPTLAPLP